MTRDQITAVEKRRSVESSMYKLECDERISNNVKSMSNDLIRMSRSEPISLTDTKKIIDVTIDYMEGCAEASTVPSITGLCRSLGIARSTFYDCLSRKIPLETAVWFQQVHDSFAELLSNSAIRGDVAPIPAIFVLKSLFGFREQNELILSQGMTQKSLLDAVTDPIERRMRIEAAVVDEE